jgi:ribosomal protein L37AE/L43A
MIVGLRARKETMKIKQITSQNRRDFSAVYECEHCGATETGYGYDDDNFHRNVIPGMKCKACGKTAAEDYRPMGTRYAAHEVV